jgi:hypothetical protein
VGAANDPIRHSYRLGLMPIDELDDLSIDCGIGADILVL